MECHELAKQLASRRPHASAESIARLCLLILNRVDDARTLRDPDVLDRELQTAIIRLDAAADQYEAVTAELDSLGNDGPIEFTPEKIWTLVRTIRVQSQTLDLYIEKPTAALN